MKALIAYAIGRGILPEKSALKEALAEDYLADPLAFLAGISGKAFGETWGPKIAGFWLTEANDGIHKMKSKDYYDIGWRPYEIRGRVVRIELKSSSEYPAFLFQQVRHPLLSGSEKPDYDILLCLGLTAGALEWWCIPSWELGDLADNGENQSPIITRHHGKKRPIWNEAQGYRDEGWFRTNAKERDVLKQYAVGSENLRARVIEVAQSHE